MFVCCLWRSPSARAVEHPFLLWNPDEAAAIREGGRLGQGSLGAVGYRRLRPLFAFSVMQDAKAGEQIKKLLGFIGARVDERPWSSII